MPLKRRFYRHPLCPKCRYDVAATVDRGGSTCPECGYELEPDELELQALPGDWTCGRGLRKALLILAVKSEICIIAAIPLLFFPVRWMLRLVEDASLMLYFLLLAAILTIIAGGGWVVGSLLTRRITDHAGFRSAALAWICGAFAWAVILFSAGTARLYGRISLPDFIWVSGLAGILATIAVVKVFLIRES